MQSEGLCTQWEQRTLRNARLFAAVVLAAGIAFAFALRELGVELPGPLLVVVLASVGTHWLLTRRLRRRRRILAEPFPAQWEAVLQQEVVFFRALSPEDQRRFRREVQVFLGEKLITGIGLKLDDTTRVLTAAGAVIPIFGFPEWEWDQIREVLIYPDRFNDEYQFDDSAADGDGRHTLGMVGTGAFNGMMILSKPDLVAGFRNSGDKRNVAVHEFAHLVDKSDGQVDGFPGVGVPRESVGPWLELVRRKMQEMRDGDSDINPYGLTNEAEFFAVATEYFFERPGVMQRKHPELYEMLAKVFNQSLADKARDFKRERESGRPKFGRNSPCPCGSGKKYKKCCLAKARKSR